MPLLPKRRKIDDKLFHYPFLLLLMSSLSCQILLLYCSPRQKNFRMNCVENETYFYLILSVYFIQADHSAYKFLKMSQKMFPRILNKWMSFYLTTVGMRSVSIPNLACQTCHRILLPFLIFWGICPQTIYGNKCSH